VPRRDVEVSPTAGAGAAAGLRLARWDAGPDSDGRTLALWDPATAGPVLTPNFGQPDVASNWWLSLSRDPLSRVTTTVWREPLTSRIVVALLGHDSDVNWAEVGPPETSAAVVEYARIGLPGVIPLFLEYPRTRVRRVLAALWRVLRNESCRTHEWKYRGRD